MAGEPGTPCRSSVAPMGLKVLDSFETRGENEEIMVTEMREEPVSLSRMQDDALQLDLLRHMEEQHFKDLAFVMGFSGQDKQPTISTG